MGKPTLVILAAGMGSRYGGLKQIDPVDDVGNKIIDFSIYDAIQAGFGKVVFIIKKEHEQDFRDCIGDAVSKHIPVAYVHQDLQMVPENFKIPEERVKPWGTTHALLCCKGAVEEPFAVINADDYYGASAYKTLCEYLTTYTDTTPHPYAMVGYKLGNTLTDKGSVTRGCCITDENGYLTEISERKHLVKTQTGAGYSEDEGKTIHPIDIDSKVSMNMWGFFPSIFEECEQSMNHFFEQEVPKNPLKSECLIPVEVDKYIKDGKATVKVLSSSDKWFGVTYKEDKEVVVESIAKLKKDGVYPNILW